ncbi:MAG TPA: TraB/GumN family protein [Lysobacter sp.]|nr:TraB/GumN family protein [Lysobacter sp.]
MRIVAALLALMAGLAHAQAPAPSPPDEVPLRELDTVVVTGVQPGPGLWKVRKGDHTLWILGTLSPLPRDFEWLSRDVEAVIAQADEVIAPPRGSVDADVGFFRRLTLLPSMLKVRNNPHGATLQDVVPPATYGRWLTLKARYLGRDGGIEKRRPIFAASELYEAAIRRTGLSLEDVVGPVVRRATKQRGLKPTEVRIEVKVEDPRGALRELSGTRLNDLECFEKTLQRIERDLDTMRERANAWAVGDVETLRALPATNQYEACMAAITDSGLAQRLGFADLRQRLEAAWLAQAQRSLERNAVTFATLPMSYLLRADGALDRLRALGYEIEEP